MTLLDLSNLESIQERIPRLERLYQNMVGMSVYDFCCQATGVAPLDEQMRRDVKVASVPVTAGGGLIGNFAAIVAQIVGEFAGVDAFVTSGTDVTGFQEAVLAGADVVFMADDDTCMAINVKTGAQSDNSDATGRIFAALLENASGGVVGKNVLVLGMGKVGRSAYRLLEEAGGNMCWYDVNPPANAPLDESTFRPDWAQARWDCIAECSTAAGIVDAENVSPESVVAAPGIPFGLTDRACQEARLVIHDELESGIVAMLCEVI